MSESVSTHQARVLVVGSHATTAAGFADNNVGMLIVMEPDMVLADEARRRFAHLGNKAAIIGGDPRRMLYKLAGPFDAIFYEVRYEAIRPDLDQRLVPGGVLSCVAAP
jgi:protein-L-isoaspartate O-methyltransferase